MVSGQGSTSKRLQTCCQASPPACHARVHCGAPRCPSCASRGDGGAEVEGASWPRAQACIPLRRGLEPRHEKERTHEPRRTWEGSECCSAAACYTVCHCPAVSRCRERSAALTLQGRSNEVKQSEHERVSAGTQQKKEQHPWSTASPAPQQGQQQHGAACRHRPRL